MSQKKIKVLLVGSVGEHFAILHKKLESLQASKAGPFDVCFCVGSIQAFKPEGETETEAAVIPDAPMPVYFQEYEAGSSLVKDSDEAIVSLGHNLFYLQGDKTTRDKSSQVIDINIGGVGGDNTCNLVIGCCSRHVRAEKETTATSTTTATKQVDLLLSSDWPQGMEDVVNADTEPLSFDVAQVAVSCRPRYHVAPSSQQYHSSPPYELPNSDHVGRFLALAPVTSLKPTKTTKFIHALGLVPLSLDPPPTKAPSTLPCPFLAQPMQLSSNTKPAPGFVMAATASSEGYSRFATKRGRQNHNDEENNDPTSLAPPDDPAINTLFLYGLHKDVTGELQSTASSKVLQAFAKYKVSRVRHPPNTATSTYCFLEFPSQSEALACLMDCQGRFSIANVDLTLKWATQSKNKRPRMDDTTRHYVTQAEAPNSTTLYFNPPHNNKEPSTGEAAAEEESSAAAKSLCAYLQTTLEEALNEGNDGDRITAETEPALKVSVRTKDNYGFLEFASHAAATMALAAVTTSTDGGLMVESPENAPKPPANLVGTTLRWAKGEVKQSKREEVLEALGLERQYHPADSRTDCWFCLASPTCETHLIAGVYQEWYATLPKGPVHPGHVLLVPVTHTREGAWTMGAEWRDLVNKLQQHASQVYDCDLLIFERAMETKGGYHSHVQCVPVPRDAVAKLQPTMLAHAKASGFDLRQIQSDLGIGTLITQDDSYFYAEILTQRQTLRFLYKHDIDTGGASVPLQFAREVLASVLQNPKLAHWKSCVVDKEQETKLTEDFRASFATFN